jgi:hypothetical protein
MVQQYKEADPTSPNYLQARYVEGSDGAPYVQFRGLETIGAQGGDSLHIYDPIRTRGCQTLRVQVVNNGSTEIDGLAFYLRVTNGAPNIQVALPQPASTSFPFIDIGRSDGRAIYNVIPAGMFVYAVLNVTALAAVGVEVGTVGGNAINSQVFALAV